MEIIKCFFNQVLFTVGVIAGFGLLIALCRRIFCKLVGIKVGARMLLITGAVGTPIHEISHAAFCLLFAHKIVAIKLYKPDFENGTLGYIQHTYNRKNLFQVIGNFFIGIAPILGGSAVIFLLMLILVPDVFFAATGELGTLNWSIADLTIPVAFWQYCQLLWHEAIIIFGFKNMGSFWWWLFFVLAFMIANHMELSWADIKGGFSGFVLIVIFWLLFDVALYFISVTALKNVTAALLSLAAAITGFLAIAVIFSIMMVLVTSLGKGLVCGIKKSCHKTDKQKKQITELQNIQKNPDLDPEY